MEIIIFFAIVAYIFWSLGRDEVKREPKPRKPRTTGETVGVVFFVVVVGCILCMLALIIGSADAQVRVQTVPVRTVNAPLLPGSGAIMQAAAIVPNPALGLGRPLGTPIVLTFENGGNIGIHRMRFLGYQREGSRIELRGPCYSACTLITSYVAKDRLCIAPGAFMAFHGAQTNEHPPQPAPGATEIMYRSYPAEIRAWIDKHGGVDKLPGPTGGYWTLHSTDLWDMGYARCP